MRVLVRAFALVGLFCLYCVAKRLMHRRAVKKDLSVFCELLSKHCLRVRTGEA